jgi:NADH-quinone oxidoreductase subunit N
MTASSLNLSLALPEIFLLVMVSLIMVADLFLSPAKREGRLVNGTLATLFVMFLLVIFNAPAGSRFAFNGMFVLDGMAVLLKAALALSVAFVVVYSRTYLAARSLLTGEFYTLLLFATFGMMIMISANHFVTLYLGLEILALSLYTMVALQRDSAVATEAAMKYFILGALASGLLLYGMSMVYGATGSLDIATIAKVVGGSRGNDPLLTFGIVFLVAGLAFKLGAVPFHMWIPDVYHGAATPVTLLIGSAPKLAAFAFVLRILADGLAGMVGDWQGMLIILAVLSMALGNVVAIAQTNLKRMLAYSTISHMGFLLLGILSGTLDGYSSGMFYVIAYVLMTLGSFGMILLLSRAGFEAENIDDFRGLNRRSPWYAFLMLVIMFSLAGIPPTIGFFAKLAVLQAALNAGLLWLVVFAVLMSVIGAFYYLRIVKLMYMDEPQDLAVIVVRPEMGVLLSINAFAVLVLGIVPGGLFEMCRRAIAISF